MRYKCIIFDCDGVLVDSEFLSNQVLIEMLIPHGIIISNSEADEIFTGKSMQSCINQIENMLGYPLENDFEKLFRAKTFEKFKHKLKPIEGIHELLEKIDIDFCVASSGPVNKIKHCLEITGLLDKFKNNIYSCYDINKWKPDPDIFIHASKKMGYEINECVVIEDSISGVLAAKTGGFDVYAYNPGRKNDLFEEIDVTCFGHMSLLIDLLKG